MKSEKLIAKYVKGELTSEEQKEFDNLINTNPDFKLEVEEYRDIHQAFKIKESEDLKGYLKSIDETEKPPKTNKYGKLIAFLTAACLIIGAFFFLDRTPSPDEMYASHFEVYPNVLQPIVRGETATSSDAFRAYENKNYNDAEVAFQNLLKTNKDVNLEFYYAMTLLNQNKFDQAKAILYNLKSKQQDFLAETYWYSALVAIKQNNFISAKKDLETLTNIDPSFKQKDREALFQVIQ
ncbi:MAG: hypothetical protein ACON5F_13065 [Jejuia sp.]